MTKHEQAVGDERQPFDAGDDPQVRHQRPTAWACRTCGKIDWADTNEQLAAPEHVSYRGVDIGTCAANGGKMVPLYSEQVNTQLANESSCQSKNRQWLPLYGS